MPFFKPLPMAALLVSTVHSMLWAQSVWTWRKPLPPSQFVAQSIIWDGKQFLAVGGRGIVLASPDGKDWSIGYSESMKNLNSVAWTGNQFIAVGDSGTIETSPDGTRWSTRNSQTHRRLIAVNSGPDQIIAVGDSGTMLSSQDVIHWTARSPDAARNLMAVYWAAGRWVAVGDDGIFTSTDGIAWSWVLKSGSDPYWRLEAVARTENLWVATGRGLLFTSPDGLTWTNQGATGSWRVTDLVWAGNRMVAVGERDVYNSTDGLTWLKTFERIDLHSVAWSGNRFVAVGFWGQPAISDDGVTWTTSGILDRLADLYSITWDGKQAIAVGQALNDSLGNEGIIRRSPDGITWSEARVNPFLRAVASNGNLTVAVGKWGAILTSQDGLAWTQRYADSGMELTGICHSGNAWLAVGSYILKESDTSGAVALFSQDGIDWIKTEPRSLGFESITWTGDQWVALATFGPLFTSPDGKAWTEQALPVADPSPGLRSVKWVHNQLFAIGRGGLLLTSGNGVDWITRNSGTREGLRDVLWTGKQFVIIGSSGITTSSDGIRWNYKESPTLPDLNATVWTGSQIIGVYYFGTIVTSAEDPILSIGPNAPRPRPFSLGIFGNRLQATLPASFGGVPVRISIHDIKGRKEYETHRAVPTSEPISLPLNGLGRGVHFFEARFRGIRLTEPFEISR